MYKESLGPLFTCLHVFIAKNFNVLKNIVPLTKALLKCGKTLNFLTYQYV